MMQIDTTRGPFFGGIGDGILLAWIAEGAKGSACELSLFATGPKREALEILGIAMHSTPTGQGLSQIFSLEQNDGGRIPRAERVCRYLGLQTRPKRPTATIPATARESAKRFWGGVRGPRMLLCPEVNDSTRRWLFWNELQCAIQQRGYEALRLTAANAKGSFTNTTAIIADADAVIAVDSACAHMAATLGVPTLVLMGPTTDNAFAHAENVRCLSVSPELQSCVGCSFQHHKLHPQCRRVGCAALFLLTAEAVAEAAVSLRPRAALLYESYADLAQRVRRWSAELPDFAAVAGLPRAGHIVASMLAAERNIHLVTIDDLIAGRTPWTTALRRNCPAKPADAPVLVVDDTVSTGNQMAAVRDRISNPAVRYGAVYGARGGKELADHVAVDVGDTPHVFEWNWQHHWFVERMSFDLDGVLCEDWKHTSEEGALAEPYSEHIESAACLMVPSFPIGEIVTARLEKHREKTEAWLARHSIRYHRLTMAPYDSPRERAANGGFAERKAAVYSASPAMLFVESCPDQAATIARITRRPVLSWPENRILNGAIL